jgi:pteridine reductase
MLSAMSQQRPKALITGGAKRVGRQIALTLAEAGYDIAFTYHTSQTEAGELVALLEKTGANAVAIQADLSDPVASVKQIASQIGELDVLVNNASIYLPGDDLEQGRRMWAVHVETPVLLCRAFEKTLRQTKGQVVNMLDVQAEKPMPSYALYCASKAALWNLTLSLARELAPEVTVNGIAPGVVEWPRDYPQADKEKYLRRVPLGRAGTPQDVASAVLFFCRDGSYVTGQVLRLDGGRSLV